MTSLEKELQAKDMQIGKLEQQMARLNHTLETQTTRVCLLVEQPLLTGTLVSDSLHCCLQMQHLESELRGRQGAVTTDLTEKLSNLQAEKAKADSERDDALKRLEELKTEVAFYTQ